MDANTFNAPSLTPARRKYAILAVLVVAAVAAGIIFFLVISSRGKDTGLSVPVLNKLTGSGQVSLRSEYRNPFDQESQYVNPFSEFKSPFHSLQQ